MEFEIASGIEPPGRRSPAHLVLDSLRQRGDFLEFLNQVDNPAPESPP